MKADRVAILNKNLDATLAESSVNHWFDKSWPDLKEKLSAIPAPSGAAPPKRPTDEMVAERLELVRAGANHDAAVMEAMDRLVGVTGAIGERLAVPSYVSRPIRFRRLPFPVRRRGP